MKRLKDSNIEGSFKNFQNTILNSIAGGFGVPFEELSLEASKNYSISQKRSSYYNHNRLTP